jgi:hypothetical protein
MSGHRSMVSVIKKEPNLRASAGTGSEKKIHT